MVIEKILKELTPERAKKEIEAIQKVKLPQKIQKLVREYEKVGERSEFLWKWLFCGDKIVIQSFNFSKKYYQLAIESTFLFNMFITLLDDISEKKGNSNLLSELLKIPLEQEHITSKPLDEKEKKYLLFTIKIWTQLEETIKKYPYYKRFKEIFRYDILQLLNTVRYFFLIYNEPYSINQSEYWAYSSHNMQVIITFDLYLMQSFDPSLKKNLGMYRETILHLQEMARIGNCLGTWEREVKEKDFTSSGVFAYMLDSGILNIENLKNKNRLSLIKKIKKTEFERKLFERWEKKYQIINKTGEKLKKINMPRLLSAIEKITFYHLMGRGKI